MDNEIGWLTLFWEDWNIRVGVLMSLSLLLLLKLLAPLRKRTSNNVIVMLIWSAYLLADKVAVLTIGFISRSKETSPLLAMWAPFLLLHLGGSDTITAFSLEDNQLWLRHLVEFGFQSATTVYVFTLTLSMSNLAVPTLLLFVAGIIKYLERTYSLYLASKEKFRDSLLRKPEPGVDYARLVNEYGPRIPDPEGATRQPSIERDADADAGYGDALPRGATRQPSIGRDADAGNGDAFEMGLILKAHRCFRRLRGLIVDLPIQEADYEEVRILWRDVTEHDSESALRMIEVELNYFYDVLYTKAVVLHSGLGMILRFIALALVVAAFLVFHVDVEKSKFESIDVRVTYTLLFGALALEILALVKALFSDWTLSGALRISLDRTYPTTLRFRLCGCLVWLYSKSLVPNRPRKRDVVDQRMLHVLAASRRCSRNISGLNFMRYCLKRSSHLPPGKCCSCIQLARATINFTRVDKVFQWLGLPDLLMEVQYKSNEQLTREVLEFILTELRTKSEEDRHNNLADAKGEWVLESHFGEEEGVRELISYIVNIPFTKSLLVWHIATVLLYYEKEVYPDDDDYKERYVSKILSDYMLYLLIMQPTMMEAVSSSDQILRFQDTCADAKRFFNQTGRKPSQLRTMCNMALDLRMDIAAHEVRQGGVGTSVFFEANKLATEMRYKVNKWKILSKVWAEILSYAASHCSSNAHAQQISKGGEFITFVWLAMAHYGLKKTLV